MEENKTQGLIGEDVKRLPVGQLLKRIGPGLIATGIVIGPGAVTTAAMLGANYGYALIWLVFPIIFMGITFVMTTNWLAITTGMPTIHAIRKYYGKAGAGFSSLLANTQRGMVLLGAGIEKDFGLESKFIRYGCLACLVFAMVICYSFNGSPTQLILIANIATSIATPIGGLFVLLLIWRKDVNEGYKAPTALRVCMTISYVFVLIMTVSAFQKTIIPGIIKLFA